MTTDPVTSQGRLRPPTWVNWPQRIEGHAELIVADDRVQFGTRNLDAWAPYRNVEIAPMVDDADVADRPVERAIGPAIGRAESEFRQGGLDRVRNWFSDELTDFRERFDHPSVSLPLAE